MFAEILLGIILGLLLVYLYFLYVKWSLEYSSQLDSPRRDVNGNIMKDSNGKTLKNNTYQFLLPPNSISDSYRPINFWITYNWLLLTLKP
jgi:hypothetical protein